MRILVLSDTHGSILKAKEVYKKLNNDKRVDYIIHCGDYFDDAIKLGSELNVKVVATKGNCDGSFLEDEFNILETEVGNILVCHGHMQHVGYSLEYLYDLALENNCIMVTFGHTHRNIFTNLNGIYIMNPGSLSKPRDGSNGTFGVIEIENDSLNGHIYTYDSFMSDKKEKMKVTTGHLSSMINYSDRF